MVIFKNAGRCGNFLFEAATSIAYALEYNLDFTVPSHTDNEKWNPIYLQHLVNKDYNPHLFKVQIFEHQHNFQELPFLEEWRNCNIEFNGYFQTEKYFSKYRNEILYLFDFPNKTNPIICLHARFGDYLTVQDANGKKKHIIVDEQYIKSAINYVKEKTGISSVKVFSDDIPLFKEKFGHLYNFEYSTNTNEFDDIVEMSCCHSFINSSSTFSWWGAWLSRNEEKVIVTQKEWFNDNWMNLDVSDIVPENWIKL